MEAVVSNRKAKDAKKEEDNAQADKDTKGKIHDRTLEDSQFFDHVGMYMLTNAMIHHYKDSDK